MEEERKDMKKFTIVHVHVIVVVVMVIIVVKIALAVAIAVAVAVEIIILISGDDNNNSLMGESLRVCDLMVIEELKERRCQSLIVAHRSE